MDTKLTHQFLLQGGKGGEMRLEAAAAMKGIEK
jgi:hypothetical protein